MALSNYTDLQTSIAAWLHRSDLTATIPDFISLAESRINAALTLRVMETETSLATVFGQNYAAMPSRMVEAICAFITISGIQTLMTRVDPAEIPAGNVNGMPQYWATDGDTIKFDCHLDNTYTITLRYKQGFALASTSTNWLMTKHPRVYLYGAQAEASLYTRDQAGMAMFESAFQQALADANRAENYATELRVDAGMNSGMYNIYKDG